MASTVLPNGIIIPEKYSRDWYNDLYHNWQELDNLLGGGGGANDGTLTIQKNGATVTTFSANQATDATANIEVPTKTSDLTNDSGFITSDDTKIPLAGSNAISGDLIPSTDNSIDVGSSTNNIKMLYTKSITIDGKTIDTDANGNMTFNGNEVLTSAIKEGNFGDSMAGWCLLYGDLLIQWGSNISSSRNFRINFTKPFSSTPTVVANYGDTSNYSTTCAVYDVHATYFNAAHSNDGAWRVNWIAIGRKGD